MQKAYSRINWENYPSEATPLNETNLNKIDGAVDEIDNRVITQDTTKLDKVTANTMVKDVSFDEETGIFTITLLNGSTKTIDTKLEKIAVNFSYDSTTQQIILTLIDGTKQYIDMSALITQYEFAESDEIYFTVESDGTVQASVKAGSITEDKLQPNYLADIKVQAEIATQSAEDATVQKSQATAEADRAKAEADKAAQYSNVVAPDFVVDTDSMTLYMKSGVGVDFVVADENILCWKIA